MKRTYHCILSMRQIETVEPNNYIIANTII